MDKKEFVAMIRVSEQMTEDHFEMKTELLKLSSDTTIGQIDAWMQGFHGRSTSELIIRELTQLPF